MPAGLNNFQKCQRENCDNLFPQKKIERERKIYMKNRDKKCGKETKETNVKRQTKCFTRTLTNSKYMKMLNEKKNCGLQKCKHEHDLFLKDFRKQTKKFKAKLDKKKKRASKKKKTKTRRK
mgnify:CR=1 FL=1|tara:strand:- start:133 stop:495 length:363 start_codon:yes stop_codon:yes gene_type:complete